VRWAELSGRRGPRPPPPPQPPRQLPPRRPIGPHPGDSPVLGGCRDGDRSPAGPALRTCGADAEERREPGRPAGHPARSGWWRTRASWGRPGRSGRSGSGQPGRSGRSGRPGRPGRSGRSGWSCWPYGTQRLRRPPQLRARRQGGLEAAVRELRPPARQCCLERQRYRPGPRRRQQARPHQRQRQQAQPLGPQRQQAQHSGPRRRQPQHSGPRRRQRRPHQPQRRPHEPQRRHSPARRRQDRWQHGRPPRRPDAAGPPGWRRWCPRGGQGPRPRAAPWCPSAGWNVPPRSSATMRRQSPTPARGP